MATNSIWLNVWEIVLLLGIGSFILLLVAVIPIGAADIKRMFTKLDAKGDSDTV